MLDEMSFHGEKSSLNNRDICMTKNQAAKQQSEKSLMLTTIGGFLGRNIAVVAYSLNMGMHNLK